MSQNDLKIYLAEIEDQSVSLLFGTSIDSLSPFYKFTTHELINKGRHLLLEIEKSLKIQISGSTRFALQINQGSSFRPGIMKTIFKQVEILKPIPQSDNIKNSLYDARDMTPVISFTDIKYVPDVGIVFDMIYCTNTYFLAYSLLSEVIKEAAYDSFLLRKHLEFYEYVNEPLANILKYKDENLARFWYYNIANEARIRVADWQTDFDFILYKQLEEAWKGIQENEKKRVIHFKHRFDIENLSSLIALRTIWDIADILYSNEIAARTYLIYDKYIESIGLKNIPDREEYTIFLWRKRRKYCEPESPLFNFINQFIDRLVKILNIKIMSCTIKNNGSTENDKMQNSYRTLANIHEALVRICDIGGSVFDDQLKGINDRLTESDIILEDKNYKNVSLGSENILRLSLTACEEGRVEYIRKRIQEKIGKFFVDQKIINNLNPEALKFEPLPGEQLWHKEGREGYEFLEKLGVPFTPVIVPAICSAHLPWMAERDAFLEDEEIQNFLRFSIVNPTFRFRSLLEFSKANKPIADLDQFIIKAAKFIREKAAEKPKCNLMGGFDEN